MTMAQSLLSYPGKEEELYVSITSNSNKSLHLDNGQMRI